MIRFLYNISLHLFFIFLIPKLLSCAICKGKYLRCLRERITPRLPKKEGRKLIWLHAVSVGEVKALATLIPHIRKTTPSVFIFVTTVTETGQSLAKQVVAGANAIAFLPLDVSWVIKPFVRALSPDLLVLVEGDYWLNLILEAKRCGGTVVVVNGKLSDASLRRYLLFPIFSKQLFAPIDHFYVQGRSYIEKFLKLHVPEHKLTVTGNLKADVPLSLPEHKECFKKELGVQKADSIITLGSTHGGEEALLIDALFPLLEKHQDLKLLVVPRHPERFHKVKTSYHSSRVIVVDQMGILSQCYSVSCIAIVGGSFVKHVGGHDIFEPAKIGVPTVFGPYMHKQKDLVHLLVSSGGGMQVSLDMLTDAVDRLLHPRRF